MTVLGDGLKLACGVTLPNRIAKAALTEGLASPEGLPTPELERLYGVWANCGAGLLITGNVQIDRDHLERPGNVVIDGVPTPELHAALSRWARVGTSGGNQLWMQISHSGRQTQNTINKHPKGPSAVKVGLPGGQFAEPVALTGEEIKDLIKRFAVTAKAAQDAGFTGVQIHAAHGYMLSSFLNPRANQRTDEWGGSLENRARFLMEAVKATREAVGPGFPISVKLNSADFQRGGFAFEDSLMVARWLQAAGIDLLEISGGTYEQPKMMDMAGMEAPELQNVAASTLEREAYFVDFAVAMKAEITMPLMVTGGFRTRAAMEQAISQGAVDVIGLGRPLCTDPSGPSRLLLGETALEKWEQQLKLIPDWLSWLLKVKLIKAVHAFAAQYWYYAQLYSLGRTGQTNLDISVWSAFREIERTHKAIMSEMRKTSGARR